MDTVGLLLSGTLLFIAVWFIFRKNKIRKEFEMRVNLIPGPKTYPFIGTMLPFLFKKRNQLFSVTQDIVREHGPLLRKWVGMVPQIHITRPEHAEIILNNSTLITKGLTYSFLEPWLGTGLLTSTGQKWHLHRKMITPTYHFKILDSFVDVFTEKSEILVKKLEKELGSQGFDAYPYITKCALDIICETAMGTAINAQEEKSSEYVNAVYGVAEIIVQRLHKPWLQSNFMFKLTKLGQSHDQYLKILHGFTKKVIQERKDAILKNKDKIPVETEDDTMGRKIRRAFLDLLLEASLNVVKLTDEELREEVDTFMFEGHDTTSAAICWALFLIGLHPEVQDMAYEEQESIFFGSDRSPTMKDLNEMKYLERVIKETLRLYPSVPTIGRSLTQEVKIGDYVIPAGCDIKLQIYNLHRNPDQFPNPEKFDPDNFLPERVTKRHPYAFIPFSAGPRNCIGQKFAILEEKTVLSSILRHYKIKSIQNRSDVTTLAELIMRPENGIRLSITPRRE